ncbi:hypothetical protein SY27_07765 [Flavobacterium sp. 316]|uniref:HNH endonuclease n=1 Tax=Flavobacterium sp. 316 TaxID=1603293 RepID=UPI0005DED775|nr:HNH endonuclease [Flavobacterium sp. 316]KIX21586.1 hypothetical protein SY27_07765 [Flavobacterium sp. 316]
MKKITLTFIALSRTTELKIKSENEIDDIVNDLFIAFADEVDFKNFKMTINCLQQNTDTLKNKINAVVQKYKESNVKFQQLNSYFKNLKEDEYFFFFANKEISSDERFQLYSYLSAHENNEDYETEKKQMDDLFGELRLVYDISAFDETTKSKIGEPDKLKRVCRFCNKPNGEVTFRKIAHSISEALGNKKIITNDECDTCNEKFGSGIENDLILYLNLYRNIFGIKGKNGIPTLKGKNFEIVNTGTIEIKHYLTGEEIEDSNYDDFKMKFETNQDIISQNIYKTLAKYALSVIDKSELVHFENTIDWINGVRETSELPKIGILTNYNLFTKHPKLIIYKRKTDDKSLPFVVAEFRFTFLTFVYIIPLSSNDELTFTKEENYKQFWNFFKHYNSASSWKFFNLNNNVPKKFVMNLNFEQRKEE